MTAAENAKGGAKHLLVHYFRLAGVVRDSDNVAEIEDVVDLIFDAAVIQASRERFVGESEGVK